MPPEWDPEPASGGGCGGGSCGIQRVRERERARARELASRAYPGLRWEPQPAWSPECACFDSTGLEGLLRDLEERAPLTGLWVEPEARGGATLWLQVGERGGSLLGFWEGFEERAAEHQEETHLCVHLSPFGPYYALQEVRVTGLRDTEGLWLTRRAERGLRDDRLAQVLKPVQGFLRAQGLQGLDPAWLEEACSGVLAEGQAPCLWNLLFRAEPWGEERSAWLPLP